MRKAISFSFKNKVISIDRHFLFVFIMLFLTVRLTYLTQFTVGSLLYQMGMILAAIYVIVEFVRARKINLGAGIIVICLFQFVFFLSTVLNSGVHFSYVVGDLYPIIFVLMFNFFLKTNARRTIEASALFFEILIYINFVIQLVFPRGLYNIGGDKAYYLFGHQNQLAIFLLIALLLGALRFDMYNQKRKRIFDFRYLCLFIVGAISVIQIWNATAIVGIVVFMVIYLIQKLSHHAFPVPVILAPIVNLVVFFVIVILQNMEWLSRLFELLGRDTSLSGRTNIWRAALASIFQHPVIGVGSAQGAVLEGFSQAHNRYLHILFIGGIIAFILFMFYIFYCCARLQQRQNEVMAFALVAYVWAILFMCQAEVYMSAMFYIAFILIQNRDLVFDQHLKVLAE